MMDFLRDLSVNEVHQLQTLACQRMGRKKSTYVVNFLHNCNKWMEAFPDDPYLTVLSPKGHWQQHLSFVIDIALPSRKSLFFFSLEESNAELIDALLTTKRISWDDKNMFPAIYDFNAPTARALASAGKVNIKSESLYYLLRIAKEDALELDQSIPERVTQGHLNESNVATVNSVWPDRYKGSESHIATAVNRNDSVALFLDDELVSWAFISYMGLFAVLQTLNEYGGRGLANAVIRILSKNVALLDRDLCCAISVSNDVSRKLFTKLGYMLLENKVSYYELEKPSKY